MLLIVDFPYWLWRYPSLGKKKYQSWSARSSFLSSKPKFRSKVRRNSMQSYKKAMAAMALTCAGLTASPPAMALDIGGRNGVSVGGNGHGGTSASIGGSSVNASVGGRSSGGLGVDASVGGSSGVNSNTTVGSGGGLGAGTRASVGGGVGQSNIGAANARAALAIDDMSSTERAKAKLRCKDILLSGGYDASLTKLCKMCLHELAACGEENDRALTTNFEVDRQRLRRG
jgi:hypothetical protein